MNNSVNSKHRWSYEEDKYCCDLFRDNYVLKANNDIELKNIYKEVNKIFPGIKFSSFVMKIQNIAQICIDEDVIKEKDLSIRPLKNYSYQNLCAFKESFKELNY